MAYMLGEQRLFILDDDADMDDDAADDADMDDDALEALQRKINNAHISEAFLILAEDLVSIHSIFLFFYLLFCVFF